MLRQAVERCPDDLWACGKHPRNFWRIAYHAAFYTDLYMQTGEHAFRPWPPAKEDAECLWEHPPVVEPNARQQMMEYIDDIAARVDSTVDALDLDSDETGFPWYPNMAKLDHQLMNLRHLQGHVGQLSEILMAHGIDTDWMAKR